jgi:hypothetical protein
MKFWAIGRVDMEYKPVFSESVSCLRHQELITATSVPDHEGRVSETSDISSVSISRDSSLSLGGLIFGYRLDNRRLDGSVNVCLEQQWLAIT